MNAAVGDSIFADLPAVPSRIVTREGAVIRPTEDVWRFKSLVGWLTFRFDRLNTLSKRMIHCLKLVFVSYLQSHASSHASNLFISFDFFRRQSEASGTRVFSQIELSHVIQHQSGLTPAKRWRLGVLRILLRDMDRLGFGITSQEALDYLNDLKIPPNSKATSIRTRDPNQGAFSDVELLTIQTALNDTFATGKIDIYAFAITWLLLGYGSRSIQLAALKERDLLVSKSERGTFYALRIPRAKQKGQNTRDTFKTRYCSKQIGFLLEQVIRHNQALREEQGLTGDDWPMFMGKEEGELVGLRFHMSAAEIAHTSRQAVERITQLKANPRRFRITMGQRAVDDGKDKYTVAEILDHSDTQSVVCYYEASAAMVLRLDRHLAMELAPIAQAFAGVLVNDETEARRGNVRGSRIYDRSLTDNVDEALGTCGQMSFCGLAVPFACYTCRHFQPWLDGPHDQLLTVLLSDRERMVDEELSSKIYTIRDRTILAVAQVVQMCSDRRDIVVVAE